MRPRGTAAELEIRRQIGGRLLLQGRKLREVAEACDVNISSVKRWKEAIRRDGLKALVSKGSPPGRESRLNDAQEAQLIDILLGGPLNAGFHNDLWTCRRVGQVIENRFGIRYHPDHVRKVLHRLGLSCQMPDQKAREQDEDEVRRWRLYTWPALKRGHANAS